VKIEKFECDLVIVTGQEKMYNQLMSQTRNSHTKIVVLKLPRLSGSVIQNKEYRRSKQSFRLYHYLFGSNLKTNEEYIVPVLSLEIYNIAKNKIPISVKSMSETQSNYPIKVESTIISPDITYKIFAVSHATTPEEILITNAASFIQILGFDSRKQQISYRSPCSCSLSGKILIAGNYNLNSKTQFLRNN